MSRLKRAVPWAGAGLLLSVVVVGFALFRGPSEAELGAIREALGTPNALVLDVRSPEEFARGHLEGALNVPHREVGERLDAVGSASRPVIVYCQSGVRSRWAASTLREAGYERVYDLGGIKNGAKVGLQLTQ